MIDAFIIVATVPLVQACAGQFPELKPLYCCRYKSDNAIDSATAYAADTSSWPVGTTRFGYGPDFAYSTPLAAASTGILEHYFR